MQVVDSLNGFLRFGTVCRTLMQKLAGGAQLVFGDVGQIQLAPGDVAVPAARYGVGVVVREGFLLQAGVELEDALLVLPGDLQTALHGFIVRCFFVPAAVDLYGGAAAVPAVGRVVGLPEVIGRRQRDAFQGGVFLTNLVIVGGAVLEQIAVTVGLDLFPACGHSG